MKRLLALLVAALIAVPVLAGCTGSDAVSTNPDGGGYTFKDATALGTLYPQGDRKTPGAFTGKLLNGGTYSSATTKGKVTVINFWATWCGACNTETPQFDSVYRAVKSRGVGFVGIDTKDTAGKARTFVEDNKISYPIVFDELGETSIRLGKLPQASLPFTVLLDKQGRVAAVYVIRLSPVDLTRSIDKLLAEK